VCDMVDPPLRTPASAPESADGDGPSAPNGNGPSPVDESREPALSLSLATPAEKPHQAHPSPWPLRTASPGPGPDHLPLSKPHFDYPDTPGTGATENQLR